MTYTDIINDEGFRKDCYSKAYLHQMARGDDVISYLSLKTDIYKLLHKTREAINKSGLYEITITYDHISWITKGSFEKTLFIEGRYFTVVEIRGKDLHTFAPSFSL